MADWTLSSNELLRQVAAGAKLLAAESKVLGTEFGMLAVPSDWTPKTYHTLIFDDLFQVVEALDVLAPGNDPVPNLQGALQSWLEEQEQEYQDSMSRSPYPFTSSQEVRTPSGDDDMSRDEWLAEGGY